MHLNTVALILVIVTALFRLAEIAYGEWNAKNMLHQGGREYAPWQRWPIFAVYALWLCLLPVFAVTYSLAPLWLMLFIACQALRWWSIKHLGPYWTTRIIVVPRAVKITTGPYGHIPHPIYIALAGEVFLLSLVFSQVYLGLFFGGLVCLWIFFRVKEENTALAQLR